MSNNSPNDHFKLPSSLDKRALKAFQRDVARDISYSTSAESKAGRGLIRLMENASGRIGLIKRAEGYDQEVAQGRDFWQVMVERYGLHLNVLNGALENIPKEGPVVVVANHPYGILDGLMLGHILSQARGDFRILAHRVFKKAEDLDRIILPVSFDETKEALATNLKTRKDALSYLAQGGVIGIFPGGTVSTSAKPFGTALDPKWRSFTAKMIAKSGATVVPICFEGTNSRLFNLASHLHVTLRMGLLIREFKTRVDRAVDISVGEPIKPQELAEYRGDPNKLMNFLRQRTYSMSRNFENDIGYGYEFEEKYGAKERISLKERY